MKLVRFGEAGTFRPGLLVGEADDLENARIVDVRAVDPILGDYDGAFFASGGMERLSVLARDAERTARPVAGRRFGPPVVPGTIFCLGKNYAAHAAEFGAELPRLPVVFSKASGSVIGPFDPIRLAPGMREVDGEVELAAVIGRRASRVKAADALAHVAGYLILNDITDREAQRTDGQWFRAKSADTFCPLGPVLVSPGAVDVSALSLRSFRNGKLLQDGASADMIFRLPEIIEFLSASITLRPGDILSTGTPSGIGSAHTPPELLHPGDVLETRIAGLGAQRNPVIGT